MSGPTYPLELDEYGDLKISSLEDEINKSIEAIILTPIGSRPIYKDFGSNATSLPMLNKNDELARFIMEDDIKSGITKFETRVIINSIEIIYSEDSPEDITIKINRTIRETNESGETIVEL
jgi:phage baseplate assembly protein W